MAARWLVGWIGQKEGKCCLHPCRLSVLPVHLTVFVCGHQLVDLLIGPGSQNLNEALLICANALQERRKMLGRAGWEVLSHKGALG